jgi:ppGpp synthetase/RelA/SpoT-type nucleotidyltranferase
MAWARPQYGKGQIDRAGEILAKEEDTFETAKDFQEYVDAVDIVSNWRTVHSYPLQAMKMTLKRRAKSIDPTAIVSQRLKRFASIMLKLRLSKEAGHHPNLSQMQDIGGCRAVMDNVQQVRTLERKFLHAARKNPLRGPEYFKTSDYLTSPKNNGYRGIHLVYKFRSNSTQHSCYSGQRIEIQLRSRLQHYWATAVETYSTFTGEALKSNIGSDEWKRFFALVSSSIAISEKNPTVPGTPSTMGEIVPELQQLYTKLNVYNVLNGWSIATRHVEKDEHAEMKNADMYLLVLDPNVFRLTITPYQRGV